MKAKKQTKKVAAKKVANSPKKNTAPVSPPSAAPTTPESNPEPTLPAPTPPTTNLPTEVTLVQVVDVKGKRYESKTDPNSNYHLRNRSQVLKPCALVREYCAQHPTMSRKQVIADLVAVGVDKNTAATQYSLWRAKNPLTLAQELAGGTAPSGDDEEVYVAGNDEE